MEHVWVILYTAGGFLLLVVLASLAIWIFKKASLPVATGGRGGSWAWGQVKKGWAWLHHKDHQDARTGVGIMVVILMGLAMPLSRTIVWSGITLIFIAGIAFWGINLFAEDKEKKARHKSFNNFLVKLVWLVFVANLTLYSLRAYGINPISNFQEWRQTALTHKAKVEQPKPDKVFELTVSPGVWSKTFEQVYGKAPEKAISDYAVNCSLVTTKDGDKVNCQTESGKKDQIDSNPAKEMKLIWSDLYKTHFQPTDGKEVKVRLTIHYN